MKQLAPPSSVKYKRFCLKLSIEIQLIKIKKFCMKTFRLIITTFLFVSFYTELFCQQPDTILLLKEKEYEIEFIRNTKHTILKWKGEKSFSYDFSDIVGHQYDVIPPNVLTMEMDSINNIDLISDNRL